jgi:VWFA-related protein
MTLRVRLTAFVISLAGAALTAGQAPPAAPQTQQPTFKVQVDFVEVDALVTDRTGNFVRDLKKEDFQVIEDGRPQTITTFSLVDLPIEQLLRPLGAELPIEPDVKSNERPFDGRVFVMVIDDYHTGFGRTERVKRAARYFIQRNLGSNDLMAVVHTAGGPDMGQEFTSNKRLLLAAVDKTMGNKLRSATAERTDEYYRTRDLGLGGPIRDPAEQERAYYARATLDTLKSVADWFAGVHGRRKSILLVSEGIDYDITDVFNNQSASTILDATREAIAAATKSNVSIYGIDPRGLTNLGDEEIEIGAYPDDPTLGINSSSLANELRLSQDSLRVLSDETGGFAAVNRNDFATAFDRILRDNSSYYVLAYYPPTIDKRDGKFHKIDVRVSRPGLTVRARKGYASPKKAPAARATSASNTPPEIRDALESPLPISGITMHVFAAPFKGAAPNASVLLGIEMRGRDLRLVPNSKVDISYIAVDTNGKIKQGNTDSVTWSNLKPDTKTRIEQGGLRMLSRLELPPGRYQLRVAARDTAGGALGTVLYDLQVPDFYKAPLSMSGLALTSPAGASSALTTKADEQLKAVLPAPPVALRAFPENDELSVFAEVYDNAASTPHKVDITTTVTSDDAKVVFKTNEERSSTDLQGKGGGYGYTARIPTRDLGSGTFVLKVEARSRLGQNPTASREVQFTVGTLRPTTSLTFAPSAATPPAAPPQHAPAAAQTPPSAAPANQLRPGAPPRAAQTPAGPASPTPAVPVLPVVTDKVPAMRTLDKGTQSNVDNARQIVVRSNDEWTTLWRLHTPDRKVPAVDFSRDMVVGVFLGTRPTAGFEAQIVDTREEAGALIIRYREVVPTIRAMTAQVLTMPYHLVVVPKRDGDVKFEKMK